MSLHKIGTYNFRKSEIGEIPFPWTDHGVHYSLGVLEGCLCTIFRPGNDECELWIMKEYGVSESWSKYVKIEGYSGFRSLVFLGFSGDGDVMMISAARSVLTRCSLTKKKMSRVPITEKCRMDRTIMYEESLVPLEFHAKVRSCEHVWEDKDEIASNIVGSVTLFNSDCIKCLRRISKMASS
ncbi:hypothetical protein Salat_0748200 [Sesamum alatum]|uniref:F-box associated domain-containing protein n=1 Tax=Sesamum alatum TaxID=300844 RepID=A0AAE2CV81_9LAMI|nr:hypothetical protein Salat_0748200 [Sesamum alatum]